MNKNIEKLESFTAYCKEFPEERFWQALRNWSKNAFILTADGMDLEYGSFKNVKDTFYDK